MQIRTNTTPPEMSLRLTPVAVRAIAKAVGDNTSLLCLDVSRSSLKDDVGVELAKSLKRNTALCRLDLEYNELGPATAAGVGGAFYASLCDVTRCATIRDAIQTRCATVRDAMPSYAILCHATMLLFSRASR